jgi:hypothetical protein
VILRLIATIITEKETASKKYFEKLIKQGGSKNKDTNNASSNGNSLQKPNELSPIELLFHQVGPLQ